MSEDQAFNLELQPSPHAVRLARRTVTTWAHSVGARSVADTAALLVSELAANAVIHAREPFTITATWRPPLFRVDVLDPVLSAMPRMRQEHEPGPGGRGLRIVHYLSHEWGVVTGGGNKAVWFDLDAGTP